MLKASEWNRVAGVLHVSPWVAVCKLVELVPLPARRRRTPAFPGVGAEDERDPWSDEAETVFDLVVSETSSEAWSEEVWSEAWSEIALSEVL